MKIVVFLLSVFISTAGAAQTITHADEVSFYANLQRNYKDIPLKVQGLWGQTSTLIMTTQQNQTHRIDNVAANSLKSSSSQNINDLSRAIRAIAAMDETDNDIALRQNVVNFLSDIKSTQETAIPNITNVLLRGTDKMTPQETTMIKVFISKGRELQTQQSRIEYLFSNYRSKHNISADELKKFGL